MLGKNNLISNETFGSPITANEPLFIDQNLLLHNTKVRRWDGDHGVPFLDWMAQEIASRINVNTTVIY